MPGVRILDMGPFSSGEANDKEDANGEEYTEVKFYGDVSADAWADINFQMAGEKNFEVKRWWWTDNNLPIGGVRTNQPGSDHDDD
jgi:hypothetical protein